MTHSLLLEVPESIYQPIVEEARAEGRKVEEIALERLAVKKPQPTADPLDEFVGAFRSGVTELGGQSRQISRRKFDARDAR